MNEGFSDLLKMGDKLNIDIENEDIIELELSEDDEYVSLIYNKTTNQYSIEYLDMSDLEEYEIPIDENTFDEFEIDDIKITREIFDRFKELINKY